MKKFNVKVYTTSDDLLVDCVMNERNLVDFLDFDDDEFIKIEDDIRGVTFLFNISQIVCVEWKEMPEIP